MPQIPKQDWSPQSAEVQANQRAAYDHLRNTCPVAYSELQNWTVFRHADVKRILLDHQSFSNQVSKHVSVPNGMDLPQHAPYRKLIEPYFSGERVAEFKPVCQAIVDELAYQSLSGPQTELMADFAEPMAARLQCAFMGWPQELADTL
ncbi:MAG: cytochrome P450, partial [Venatoribacter sp.]